MATDAGNDANPLEYPHVVAINSRKTESLRWLESHDISGIYAWDIMRVIIVDGMIERAIDPDVRDIRMVVGFTDANAAFEFKIRWG